MNISTFGFNSYRIQSDGVTVITNPFDASHQFKIARQSADILLLSEKSDESIEAISGSPFVIAAPGEYEVKSVFVYGIPTNGQTMYLIEADDITIAFIGTVHIKELSDKHLELLEGADIFIVPVGGKNVPNAKEAAHMINQIEPRLVIPSYYHSSSAKDLDTVEAFFKEYAAPKEEMDKLKISKKDLQTEDTRIVVLKP